MAYLNKRYELSLSMADIAAAIAKSYDVPVSPKVVCKVLDGTAVAPQPEAPDYLTFVWAVDVEATPA